MHHHRCRLRGLWAAQQPTSPKQSSNFVRGSTCATAASTSRDNQSACVASAGSPGSVWYNATFCQKKTLRKLGKPSRSREKKPLTTTPPAALLVPIRGDGRGCWQLRARGRVWAGCVPNALPRSSRQLTPPSQRPRTTPPTWRGCCAPPRTRCCLLRRRLRRASRPCPRSPPPPASSRPPCLRPRRRCCGWATSPPRGAPCSRARRSRPSPTPSSSVREKQCRPLALSSAPAAARRPF